ncbi:ttl domain containing protein [Stylonychia lemnae]|uniref:Ttl domain containing protein n=1 Tax=Stylonychia lemnae TaxID=5949 RepID=A0A078ADU8_STYLE|nr:ttl domain containing protein [Stylonychia lemnae]|eukprot:CDW80379.1 ttl domain containing protein [Stylonychia lemnae]
MLGNRIEIRDMKSVLLESLKNSQLGGESFLQNNNTGGLGMNLPTVEAQLEYSASFNNPPASTNYNQKMPISEIQNKLQKYSQSVKPNYSSQNNINKIVVESNSKDGSSGHKKRLSINSLKQKSSHYIAASQQSSNTNLAGINGYFKMPNLDDKQLKGSTIINSSLYRVKDLYQNNNLNAPIVPGQTQTDIPANLLSFNSSQKSPGTIKIKSSAQKNQANNNTMNQLLNQNLINMGTKQQSNQKSGHLFSYNEIRDQKMNSQPNNRNRGTQGSKSIVQKQQQSNFYIKQNREFNENDVSQILVIQNLITQGPYNRKIHFIQQGLHSQNNPQQIQEKFTESKLQSRDRDRHTNINLVGTPLDKKRNVNDTELFAADDIFNIFVGSRSKQKQVGLIKAQSTQEAQSNALEEKPLDQIQPIICKSPSSEYDIIKHTITSSQSYTRVVHNQKDILQPVRQQLNQQQKLPFLRPRQYAQNQIVQKGKSLNDVIQNKLENKSETIINDEKNPQMSTTATSTGSQCTTTISNYYQDAKRGSKSDNRLGVLKQNQLKANINSELIKEAVGTLSQQNDKDSASNQQKQLNYLKQKSDRVQSTNLKRGVRPVIYRNDTIKESVTEESKLDNNQVSSNVQQLQAIRLPKRVNNPYEEQAKEYERMQQQRVEARQKYSVISANQDTRQKIWKFIVKEGNNHHIIKRILSNRQMNPETSQVYWDEASNYDNLFNFKWQPFSNGLKYEYVSKYGQKQMVNHIQGHENLTTKDLLFINLKAHCEKSQLNVFDQMPLTFILDFKSDHIQDQYDQFRSVFKIIEQNIDSTADELSNKIQQIQFQNERKSYQSKNQYKLLHSSHDHQNLWLLKPTGLNRGRGIHIFKQIDELKQILLEYYDIKWQNQQTTPGQTIKKPTSEENKEEIEAQQQKYKSFGFVIQKYVERPLLFKGRKFDVRVWALINYDQKCYVFKTSCENYNLSNDNLDKIYVHLTNNAIQKYSDNYGKFEDGNQISLLELSSFLATQDCNTEDMNGYEIKNNLESQHKELIISSLQSVKSKLKFTKYTFELVGYDFIIDENLKSYIIEVNTNPCIEESSQLLKMLLPRMIDDMFKLTIDQVFPINIGSNNQISPFKVIDYPDDINMWEYLYTIPQN